MAFNNPYSHAQAHRPHQLFQWALNPSDIVPFQSSMPLLGHQPSWPPPLSAYWGSGLPGLLGLTVLYLVYRLQPASHPSQLWAMALVAL